MLTTHNSFGKISIHKKAISKIAAICATDSYGVVELKSRSGKQNTQLAREKYRGKGVKVSFVDNKIVIDIFLILKYGVSIPAISQSIRSAVKYKVEKFSGMTVESVSLHIVGIRV